MLGFMYKACFLFTHSKILNVTNMKCNKESKTGNEASVKEIKRMRMG